eukprot:3861547-Alexandrium_andersonii.AAC.1
MHLCCPPWQGGLAHQDRHTLLGPQGGHQGSGLPSCKAWQSLHVVSCAVQGAGVCWGRVWGQAGQFGVAVVGKG